MKVAGSKILICAAAGDLGGVGGESEEDYTCSSVLRMHR